MYNRFLVTSDSKPLLDLLPDLIENYETWEFGWDWYGHHIGKRNNGLFYTLDDRDGGEFSVGGHCFRPSLNSFMFCDAVAISKIAKIAGKPDIEKKFINKADRIKNLVQNKLWDKEANFFKVLSTDMVEKDIDEVSSSLSDARELYGYTPWYFNMPDKGY